jgi:hypothetical protein
MWRSEWMIQPFLYTNMRLRQRNNTTVGRVVPSYLPRDYNGGLLSDCSKLLRFRNIGVHHTPSFHESGGIYRPIWIMYSESTRAYGHSIALKHLTEWVKQV